MKIVTGTFVVIALFIGHAGAIAAPADQSTDDSCHYEEMCNPGEKCRQVLVCPNDDDSNDTQDNG